MDEDTADILNRAKLRREALLKRVQEEGLKDIKYSESRLDSGSRTDISSKNSALDAQSKPVKSIPRRSSSFSDLSRKPIKDRLLSWKLRDEEQQLESKSVGNSLWSKVNSIQKINACGSLTNLTANDYQEKKFLKSSKESLTTMNNINTIEKSEMSNFMQSNKKSKTYFANPSEDVSSKALMKGKENVDSSKKHYFEPKFSTCNTKVGASSAATTSAASTKKLGPATFGIQEKLSRLCQDAWKKNNIAEEMSKKKEEDMKLLKSRWKDGMVNDDHVNYGGGEYDHHSDKKSGNNLDRCTGISEFKSEIQVEPVIIRMDENGIPVPPPLPTAGFLPLKSSTNTQSVSRSDNISVVAATSSRNSGQCKSINSNKKGVKISNSILSKAKNTLGASNNCKSSANVKIGVLGNKHPNSTSSAYPAAGGSSNLKSSDAKQCSNNITTKNILPTNKSTGKAVNTITSSSGTSITSGISTASSKNFNRPPKPFCKQQLEKRFAPVTVNKLMKSDSITSTNSVTDKLVNDFECNLLAMGFQMQKDQANEAVVELESMAEDESEKVSQKLNHANILRSKEHTSKSRIKSHVENSFGNKLNKSPTTLAPRPISLIERKQVSTHFDKHDVVTVTKKKLFQLDTCANNQGKDDLSIPARIEVKLSGNSEIVSKSVEMKNGAGKSHISGILKKTKTVDDNTGFSQIQNKFEPSCDKLETNFNKCINFKLNECDDTEGYSDDDGDHKRDTVSTISSESSSGSFTVGRRFQPKETYFSVTDVHDSRKTNPTRDEDDSVYIQMSNKQKSKDIINREINNTNELTNDNYGTADDENDEDICYSNSENERAIYDDGLYEEIKDTSVMPKVTECNTRRQVSMRRAFKSYDSDDDDDDDGGGGSDDSYPVGFDWKNGLLREGKNNQGIRSRPATTTNATLDSINFNMVTHSSPIPGSDRNHRAPGHSKNRGDDFGGSCRDISQLNKRERSGSSKRRRVSRSKDGQRFKSEESLEKSAYRRLAEARVCGMPTGRCDDSKVKHHVEQFLERRGFSGSGKQEFPTPGGLGMGDCGAASSNPPLPAKPVRVKMESLEEMIQQEDKFSTQASNALNICMNKSNLWTAEAIECHKILLSTAKRKDILLNELKKLREGHRKGIGTDPTQLISPPWVGKLVISDLRLPLKPQYIAKMGTIHDTTVTHFVVIVQSGESMSTTRTISTTEPMVLGSLEVPGQLNIAGVPRNFVALLEIYALSVPRDLKSSMTKKVRAVRKADEKKKRIRFPSKTDSEDETSSSYSLRTSCFLPVGRLNLSWEELTKGHFSLEGVSYDCPLQGSIHLKMKHILETSVQHRGYLDVCTEGKREFTRRWCCLTQNEINLWRNASDELVKEPILQIDLMSCISEQLVPVAIDYRSRKDTFELVVVIQSGQSGGRQKERTTTGNSVLHQTRFWMTADSPEDCFLWCELINRTVFQLRTWHPYAIPSVKFKAPHLSPFTFASVI